MARNFEALVGQNLVTGHTTPKMPDVDAEAGRIPACLLIDTSGSMAPFKDRLEEAAVRMIEATATHSIAGEKIDLGVFTFNTNEMVNIRIEMQELYNLVDTTGKLKSEFSSRLSLECGGATPTAYALEVAVKELRNRYKKLKEAGKSPEGSPILLFLSDGLPEVQEEKREEHDKLLREQITRIRTLVSEKRLVVVSVEVGRICEEPRDDWERKTYPKMHKLMQDITGLDNNWHVRQAKDVKSLEDFFEFTSSLIVRSATNPEIDLNQMDLRHSELV